eukprot:TRINITY_DN25487_c0_g1_i1.p1 TRINITY_DN25487_c0_g1~~TRINITY_DN25487_c0_g1_i1.p1  ORF type:complete len:168 (+),score=9.99 TRINITY_DN25487_c0_g1_i1:30-533(+)
MSWFSGLPTGAAAALDAADGQRNGRYYGRPIIQAGGPGPGTRAPVAGVQETFTGAAGGFAGTQNPSLALDAADGRVDGRYFGRPIVQAAPTYTQPLYTPSMTVQNANPGLQTYGGAYGGTGAYYPGANTVYPGAPAPTQYGAPGTFGYGSFGPGAFPGATFGGQTVF